MATVDRAAVENFFIGKNKYVKNTKATPIYHMAGEAPYRTVPPNDTIGKVVRINENMKWGILESGDWILLSDSMFTVNLTTPPPTSVTNAVTRELSGIAKDIFSNKWVITIIIVLLLLIGLIIYTKFF